MLHTSVQVNPTTHTQLRLCAENSIVEELNFSGADWIATLCCEMLPVNENPSIVLVRPRWNNEWDKSCHYLLIYSYRFSFWAASLIWFSRGNCSSFLILILSPKQKNLTQIVYVGINLLNQLNCILELNTKMFWLVQKPLSCWNRRENAVYYIYKKNWQKLKFPCRSIDKIIVVEFCFIGIQKLTHCSRYCHRHLRQPDKKAIFKGNWNKPPHVLHSEWAKWEHLISNAWNCTQQSKQSTGCHLREHKLYTNGFINTTLLSMDTVRITLLT